MKSYNWKDIRNSMAKGCVKVTFKKANGEDREMECTLAEYLLPETTQASNHTEGETMVVFDLEASAWRSFRFDRVTDVEVL